MSILEPDTDGHYASEHAKYYNPPIEFQDWVTDNEDDLLVRFIDKHPEVGAVKGWDALIVTQWNNYCEKEWEEACEEYGAD